MKRVTIEVTEQESHRLKAMAALQGKSIKEFVLASTIGTDEGKALAEPTAVAKADYLPRSRTRIRFSGCCGR